MIKEFTCNIANIYVLTLVFHFLIPDVQMKIFADIVC